MAILSSHTPKVNRHVPISFCVQNLDFGARSRLSSLPWTNVVRIRTTASVASIFSVPEASVAKWSAAERCCLP